ncbi:uncharacterized protein PAF06_001040 [Gastrophryne carolinensis]
MNKWIAIGFFALLTCQLGVALECYTCDFGTCTFPSTKACSLLEVCLTEKASYGKMEIQKKSCASPSQCIGEREDTYMGFKVTKKPTCCITELCNSAVKASTSVATSIAALLSLCIAWLL